MSDLVCFHNPDDENPWFSNWYKSEFYLGGTTFTSLEQYMMFHKAALFGDHTAMQAILAVDDPARIKAWGRRVQGYNDRIWAGLRQIIVYEGLVEKFRQNVDLRRHLLDTGDAMLAECSDSDKIWGTGIGIRDPRRFDMGQWTGQNLMGFTLMLVREALR